VRQTHHLGERSERIRCVAPGMWPSRSRSGSRSIRRRTRPRFGDSACRTVTMKSAPVNTCSSPNFVRRGLGLAPVDRPRGSGRQVPSSGDCGRTHSFAWAERSILMRLRGEHRIAHALRVLPLPQADVSRAAVHTPVAWRRLPDDARRATRSRVAGPRCGRTACSRSSNGR